MFNRDQISEEFQALVEKRHGRTNWNSPGFRSHEVEAMAPHEFALVLHHAANVQRAEPENRMLELQRVTGGGLYSHSAEHIGDLTHRLNEGGGRFGSEFVEPKVRTQLRGLQHKYGYEREHLEQMRSNAAYAGVDFEEHMEKVRTAGEAYSQAHGTIPVYNAPSQRAAWAAQDLGRMNFGNTEMWMHSLSKTLRDSTQFKHLMSQAGSVEFLRKHEES